MTAASRPDRAISLMVPAELADALEVVAARYQQNLQELTRRILENVAALAPLLPSDRKAPRH